MKVKVSEVVALVQADVKALSDPRLRVHVAYVLARLRRSVLEAYNAYDEVRMQIMRKYCVKDDTGQDKLTVGVNGMPEFVFDPPEKRFIANREMEALLKQDTTVLMDKPKIQIGDVNGIFSSSDIFLLLPFVSFIDQEEIREKRNAKGIL